VLIFNNSSIRALKAINRGFRVLFCLGVRSAIKGSKDP
jgi:hypothetical protein